MPTPLSVRLSSGMQIEINPREWPEIGDAQWTTQQQGGVVQAHVVARRHPDGRVILYIDSNPGEGPLVRGHLLPSAASQIEQAIGRFGELHAVPSWVMTRLLQSVQG